MRAFLAENLPPPRERGRNFQEPWQRKLAERRWIGFAWPRDESGGGGTLIEQFILKEEMARAGAPPLGSDFMGLAWVGPALIRFGTDEQKQRFLPDLLKCRSLWCTGYSEPDHGSDLASLETRAMLAGDEYVVNGQKIWTTQAHVAKWIFMLVRTTPEKESRYGGVTCPLVPMDTPGIQVRPSCIWSVSTASTRCSSTTFGSR